MGHTPSSPPAKGCSCRHLAARDCTQDCPGSWGRQYWPGSSTPRRWSGKAHTCLLAHAKSTSSADSQTLQGSRLDSAVEGRMAPPLYSDHKGPPGTSSTWYRRGTKGATLTAEDWPEDPTRHLNWSVSLLKEPVRRKKEAERREKEAGTRKEPQRRKKVVRKKKKVVERSRKEKRRIRELDEWYLATFGKSTLVLIPGPLPPADSSAYSIPTSTPCGSPTDSGSSTPSGYPTPSGSPTYSGSSTPYGYPTHSGSSTPSGSPTFLGSPTISGSSTPSNSPTDPGSSTHSCSPTSFGSVKPCSPNLPSNLPQASRPARGWDCLKIPGRTLKGGAERPTITCRHNCGKVMPRTQKSKMSRHQQDCNGPFPAPTPITPPPSSQTSPASSPPPTPTLTPLHTTALTPLPNNASSPLYTPTTTPPPAHTRLTPATTPRASPPTTPPATPGPTVSGVSPQIETPVSQVL